MYMKIKNIKKINGKVEITKSYEQDIIVGNCKNCSHCISYVDEDGQNNYCRVDDEYKYPTEESFKCPFISGTNTDIKSVEINKEYIW